MSRHILNGITSGRSKAPCQPKARAKRQSEQRRRVPSKRKRQTIRSPRSSEAAALHATIQQCVAVGVAARPSGSSSSRCLRWPRWPSAASLPPCCVLLSWRRFAVALLAYVAPLRVNMLPDSAV